MDTRLCSDKFFICVMEKPSCIFMCGCFVLDVMDIITVTIINNLEVDLISVAMTNGGSCFGYFVFRVGIN